MPSNPALRASETTAPSLRRLQDALAYARATAMHLARGHDVGALTWLASHLPSLIAADADRQRMDYLEQNSDILPPHATLREAVDAERAKAT